MELSNISGASIFGVRWNSDAVGRKSQSAAAALSVGMRSAEHNSFLPILSSGSSDMSVVGMFRNASGGKSNGTSAMVFRVRYQRMCVASERRLEARLFRGALLGACEWRLANGGGKRAGVGKEWSGKFH